LTPYEVEVRKARAKEAELKKTQNIKKFTVPEGLLNDWTGNRFMKHPYGVDRNLENTFVYLPEPKKEEKKEEKKKLSDEE